MDSSLQQFIISAVTFAVIIAIAAMQAKYENKMLSLHEMIEKSLLLREFPSTTLPLDLDATPKALSGSDSLPKTTTKR